LLLLRAGRPKSVEDSENCGQDAATAPKMTAPLDVPYPYDLVCTADKNDGVAPAWEVALYALFLLATDAVLRATGKRGRGDAAASSSCPFAAALRDAAVCEKVGAVAFGPYGVQTLPFRHCPWWHRTTSTRPMVQTLVAFPLQWMAFQTLMACVLCVWVLSVEQHVWVHTLGETR
jgi:hypothetical protein